MDLLLFDDAADDAPARVVPLDRRTHRTGGYWHGFVPGIRAGQVYGYRAHGPWLPEVGLRFDDRHVLLDPYGRGVAVPAGYARDLGPGRGRLRGPRDEERRRRPRGLRLGGRRAAAAPAPRHRGLRGAPPRLHGPPELRRRARPAGHLRRVHRAASRTSSTSG